MAILFVEAGLLLLHGRRPGRDCRHSPGVCFCGRMASSSKRSHTTAGTGWNPSLLRIAVLCISDSSGVCSDKRFRHSTNGPGRHQRLRRLATALANDENWDGRIRRLYRDEDRSRHRCWDRRGDRHYYSRSDHRHSYRRSQPSRNRDRQISRTHLECLYDHYGGSSGKYFAGGFSLSGITDLGSDNRFLPRLLNLLFRRKISASQRSSLSGSRATGNDFPAKSGNAPTVPPYPEPTG